MGRGKGRHARFHSASFHLHHLPVLFLSTGIITGSAMLTGELRDRKASLPLSFLRSKEPLIVQATHPIGTLWEGAVQGLPLPRPQRGGSLLLLISRAALMRTRPERGTAQAPGGTYHCSEPQGPPPAQPGPPESGSRAPGAGEAIYTHTLQRLLG